MPRILLTIAAAIAAIATGPVASAADLPLKAPQAAALATYDWSGFYIGAHAGYGFGVGKTTQPIDTDFFGSRGFIGGALAGYDFMLAPRWLLGIEGDASWSNISHKDSFDDGFGDIFTLNIKQKQAYSLRGRIGYLLAPETLLYGTAGWAWSQFDYSAAVSISGIGIESESDSHWFNGPQVGGGIETMFAPGWIARLEYLQSFYNSGAFNSSFFGVLGPGLEMRPSIGIGRLALIYKFGSHASSSWEAPPVTPSWNGLYIGGAIGAGVANSKIEFNNAPPNQIDGIGVAGVFPTAMVGYDWRFDSRWVLGAEGEVAPGISTADFKVDWTAALRGRLGYLLTPATMLYGSVGWVTTGIRTTSLVMDLISVPSQRVNAIAVGGGVETAITDHWLARFDYQYAFAKTVNDVTVNAGGTLVGTVTGHPQFQYARLGLVYLLDGR